jgi:putative ABC transport system substrate-binding protein
VKRPTLFLLWLIALGCAASSQPSPERGYRVALISISAGSIERLRRYLVPELAKHGFVEGRNLTIDARFGEPDQIPTLAKELAGTKPDVVIAATNTVVQAVASASPETPIVASSFGSDPVAEGLAASLAKPGGKITGIAMLAEALDAKRLNILSESLPQVRKVAVLAGRPPRHDANVKAMQLMAQTLGLALTVVEADSPSDYPEAFGRMQAAGVQGLVIISAPDFFRDAALLAQTARAAGLPAICEWREMAESGCLMAYGPISQELTRRAAAYVVQILRGVAPGELPIETPTHFEFTLNLKTAAALGVQFPPSVLIRADEVIE